MEANLRRRRKQVDNYLEWRQYEEHFIFWEVPVFNLLKNSTCLSVLPLLETIIAAQSILQQKQADRDVFQYRRILLNIHLQIFNIIN
jgi:hypothetical protein